MYLVETCHDNCKAVVEELGLGVADTGDDGQLVGVAHHDVRNHHFQLSYQSSNWNDKWIMFKSVTPTATFDGKLLSFVTLSCDVALSTVQIGYYIQLCSNALIGPKFSPSQSNWIFYQWSQSKQFSVFVIKDKVQTEFVVGNATDVGKYLEFKLNHHTYLVRILIQLQRSHTLQSLPQELELMTRSRMPYFGRSPHPGRPSRVIASLALLLRNARRPFHQTFAFVELSIVLKFFFWELPTELCRRKASIMTNYSWP